MLGLYPFTRKKNNMKTSTKVIDPFTAYLLGISVGSLSSGSHFIEASVFVCIAVFVATYLPTVKTNASLVLSLASIIFGVFFINQELESCANIKGLVSCIISNEMALMVGLLLATVVFSYYVNFA